MQRRSTYTRIAAVLFVLEVALSQGHVLVQGRQVAPGLEDEAAELTGTLRQIDADVTLAGRDPVSRRAKALVVQGAINFFRPFPGGTAAPARPATLRGTGSRCHRPGSKPGGSACKRPGATTRNATDPLFRPLDADDGVDDYTLLRTRALVNRDRRKCGQGSTRKRNTRNTGAAAKHRSTSLLFKRFRG